MLLAVLLLFSGCAVDQSTDVDMCHGLNRGWSRVKEVRTDHWPWNPQHALIATRDEAGACKVELEQASPSDILNQLESPISAAASHVVIVP